MRDITAKINKIWISIRTWVQSRPRRQVWVFFFVFGILFLSITAVGSVLWSKRNQYLDDAISKIKTRAKNDYLIDLEIGKAGFAGLRTIRFQDVTLRAFQADSITSPITDSAFLMAKDTRISVRIWPLLRGEVQFSNVFMDDLQVMALQRDSLNNYGFLRTRTIDPDSAAVDSAALIEEVSFAEKASHLLRQAFRTIPVHVQLQNARLIFQTDSVRQTVQMADFTMRSGDFDALIEVDNGYSWRFSGEIRPQRQQMLLRLEAVSDDATLPILEDKFGLRLGFDLIELRLAEVVRVGNDRLKLSVASHVQNMRIQHRRLSDQPLLWPAGFMDGEILFGRDYIELTDKSSIQMEKLEATPYLRYSREPQAIFDFSLRTPEMDAQDFFDAWPVGLFSSLEGIRVSGKLQYNMEGRFDTSNPDDVHFESGLEKNDFKVNSWGKVNPTVINNTFEHQPFEEDQDVQPFLVGPQNATFVPLEQISPHLKNAVLTTEDPSFFRHNGFVMESIRASIATNFKEKAFTRGGSTISMQLVKNVFLHHNKTILRKLEEILLVWLIENTRAVSKDRMFEVYLNAIEWGRQVYGIGSASQYYFGKHASELTVGESIYLASIVPRPKTGIYAFDHTGHLKPYIHRYFTYVGSIMENRGLVTADSTGNYGYYQVRLQERLRPQAPVGVDTLRLLPPEMRFDFTLPQIDL